MTQSERRTMRRTVEKIRALKARPALRAAIALREASITTGTAIKDEAVAKVIENATATPTREEITQNLGDALADYREHYGDEATKSFVRGFLGCVVY